MLRVSGWFWKQMVGAEGLRMVLGAAGRWLESQDGSGRSWQVARVSGWFWEQMAGAEGLRMVLGTAGRC